MEGNLELPNKIASPRGRKFPELGRKRSELNKCFQSWKENVQSGMLL